MENEKIRCTIGACGLNDLNEHCTARLEDITPNSFKCKQMLLVCPEKLRYKLRMMKTLK
jgi:hypothetical protein